VLFDVSNAFRQLKNPVLRRTVARVTTLQQAALVGGIRVEELVNKLRDAACMSNYEGNDSGPAPIAFEGEVPIWFSANKIGAQLDAREMLNRGEHPVGQVLADLTALPDGSIYELTAPFFPAPLIDKATAIGFRHYVKMISPEEYRIYFAR